MILSYQTYPIFGREALHNLQGQISSPFLFFIFVLNSLKYIEFLYSDGNLAQRNGAL